jgi:uncharacterized protein YjbI with pentapeptide repeats
MPIASPRLYDAEAILSAASSGQTVGGDAEWAVVQGSELGKAICDARFAERDRNLGIVNAIILGPIAVRRRRVSGNLTFYNCLIPEVDFTDSTLSDLAFMHCSLGGISLAKATVEGDLTIDETEVAGSPLDLFRARIDGSAIITDCRLSNISGQSARLSGCSVGSILSFENTQFFGELNAIGLRVGGQFKLDNALLSNPAGACAYFDDLEVGLRMFAREIECRGSFMADRMRISGTVDFEGARFSGQEGSIALRGSSIKGSLDLNHAKVSGTLNLQGVKVEASLELTAAQINGGISGVAIRLSEAWIGGSVRAPGVIVNGVVLAHMLEVRGQLVIEDGEFRSHARSDALDGSLNLDGLIVGSGLFAHGVQIDGGLRIPRSTIGRHCDLSAARLETAAGNTLDMLGAHIGGALLFNDVTSRGPVVLRELVVDGRADLQRLVVVADGTGAALDVARGSFSDVNLTHGRFDGRINMMDGSFANIYLHGTKITSHSSFSMRMSRARVSGMLDAVDVDFRGSLTAPHLKIGGRFRIHGRVTNPTGPGAAMNLEDAEFGRLNIAGTIDRKLGSGGGRIAGINLQGAKIDHLVLPRTKARADRLGRLEAAGWDVRDIVGHTSTQLKIARRWLNSGPYNASAWWSLAGVWDRTGQPTLARRARFGVALQSARRTPTAGPRLISYALGLLTGWGFYPLLTVAWLIFTGLLVAGIGHSQRDAFVPTFPERATAAAEAAADDRGGDPPNEISAATECHSLGMYPCFNPGTYALSTITPASALVPSAWAPSSSSDAWVEWTVLTLRMAGWLLTVVLLAGVTGLLRKP